MRNFLIGFSFLLTGLIVPQQATARTKAKFSFVLGLKQIALYDFYFDNQYSKDVSTLQKERGNYQFRGLLRPNLGFEWRKKFNKRLGIIYGVYAIDNSFAVDFRYVSSNINVKQSFTQNQVDFILPVLLSINVTRKIDLTTGLLLKSPLPIYFAQNDSKISYESKDTIYYTGSFTSDMAELNAPADIFKFMKLQFGGRYHFSEKSALNIWMSIDLRYQENLRIENQVLEPGFNQNKHFVLYGAPINYSFGVGYQYTFPRKDKPNN